jgi:hypothetical protein
MIARIGNPLTALALWLAFAIAAEAQPPAGQKGKPPEPKEQTFSFSTGYLGDPFNQDEGRAAYYIHLRVAVDAKGGGKGTMEFDPNNNRKYNEFGDALPGPSTEIAVRKIEITLKHVKADAAGRRLYDIQGQRWSLVVSPEPISDQAMGHRLIWKDKEGKTQRVLPLEAEGKPNLKPCHPGCFPAKTNILTPDGARSIETIRAGDQILAVDKKGKPCPAKVRSVFVSQAFLFEVETESGRLTTTGKQPLCVSGGTCKTAEDLVPGEELLRWQDGTGRPTKIRAIHQTNQLANVFNLVLEDQEYFIAGGFVVRSKPPALAEAIGAAAEQGRKPE